MEGEEIEIKHKIECRIKEENNFRLFVDKFVENNKKNCKMFINGVENQLISNFEITDRVFKAKLIINIKIINNITDLSHLFDGCQSSYIEISNFNTSNIIDMSYFFNNCKNLKELPNIANWDISKVENVNFFLQDAKNYHLFQIFQNGKLII